MSLRQHRHLTAEMAVDVPEGAHGHCAVERFDVPREGLENLRLDLDGRGCQPGTYTKMMLNGQLWMSDTTAERRDHLAPAMRIVYGPLNDGPAERVLIGGLGLGMILRVALLTRGVRHVDVVELDPDVLALVGPHYQAMADANDTELVLHQADVFDIKWTPGTTWEVAWFDVWGDVSTDDLAEIARLRRSYGRRTAWSDCWGRHMLLRQRQRDQREWSW